MRVTLSQSSGVPLYEQIVEQVLRAILAGELRPGEPLPSLRALAADLRVSLITTTRAYAELAAAGWIVSVPGKGAFVADVKPDKARADVLERARAAIAGAVDLARGSGAASLADLWGLLEEEWNR